MVKAADSKSAGVTLTGSNPVADVFLLEHPFSIKQLAKLFLGLMISDRFFILVIGD